MVCDVWSDVVRSNGYEHSSHVVRASVDSVGACETTTYELELVAQDCPGGSAADSITLSVNYVS